MNDSAIKTFCVQAREKLEQGVELRMQKYGIAAESVPNAAADAVGALPLSPIEREQRAELLQLQAKLGEGDAAHGNARLKERAAYTWFNRMVAIRFMELRDFLPSRVRMFSRPDGSFGSQAVDEALDLEIEGLDAVRVLRLKQASDDEALFRYLFLAQCQELASCIPNVFEPVDSALELLLPDRLMARDGVAQAMVEDIPEEDWLTHVEILGWMYQYYNSQAKDDFFKSKSKATADTLPVATQLFTPEWIVCYMVENSLGRLWMLNNPQSGLRERMEYYIEPDAEHEDFIHINGPEEITLCDPACGSGHILVYAFDLLFAMYEERGYREREIPQLILQNNLTGLEIDPRAAQIASLALAMCAREHDRRFFGRGVQANINVVAPVHIDAEELPATAPLLGQPQLMDALAHLDEIGSLLNPTEAELEAVSATADQLARVASSDMFAASAAEKLQQAKATCELLAKRYTCVVANPPYMGSSSFGPFMSKWVKKNYPDVKSDLFSSFVVRMFNLAKDHGECGVMSPFVWMFIGSYEKLRNEIIDNRTLTSLIQLEYSGFAGATVPICTYTFHNSFIKGYKGGYVRLSDFVGAAVQAPKALEAIGNPDCGWFYRRDAETFKQIPGTPIAYWASDALLDAFANAKQLNEYGKPRQGLATGENARFVREWWEVDDQASSYSCQSVQESVSSACKWFPYNKGGDFRKWYGNNECVINWENDGHSVREYPGSVIRNPDYYFRSSITWSKISSGSIAFRFKPAGHVFDVAGTSVFSDADSLKYLQGACNSSVIMRVASMLSPTLNFEVGQIATYPIIQNEELGPSVNATVESCRELSKTDWDSFETSWDFKRHPLL
ncbi:MAG: BREX-1 system adenine-specific DNA-methyltransferase PglX [Slackia isoflavoniconvertens]|nr:BREX-1 system adenine-specific DNA-methyltransferase PglX [Slackia isoflavoniconvertens]